MRLGLIPRTYFLQNIDQVSRLDIDFTSKKKVSLENTKVNLLISFQARVKIWKKNKIK